MALGLQKTAKHLGWTNELLHYILSCCCYTYRENVTKAALRVAAVMFIASRFVNTYMYTFGQAA